MDVILMVWVSILVVGFVGFWLCVYYVSSQWEKVNEELLTDRERWLYRVTHRITYKNIHTKEIKTVYK